MTTPVQTVNVRLQGTGIDAQITLPGVTAGNFISVTATNFTSIGGVASSNGGTLTKAVSYADGSPGADYNEVGIWYLADVAAGTHVLTITSSGSGPDSYISAVASEWPGVVTSSPLDRTGTGADSLTATASAANTQADILVLTATVADGGASNNNFGTPSGYTLLDRENDSNNFTGYQAAHKTVSASETSSATHTATGLSSSQYDTVIATFKLTGGGGGTTPTDATPAAGAATVSGAGASRAASAATAAAGVATVSAAGAAGSATTATAAAGAATVSGAGASSAATTATPAAGSATVSATTDSGTVSATDAVPAAGSATVSASGSSTAETTATPAAGFATVSGNTSDIDYEAMAAAVWAYTLPNGKTAAETAVETLALLEALAAEPGCLDVPIEGIYTGADLLRVIAAVQAGKTTITPTAPDEATVAFRAIDDSTTRVTATMDGSERTDVDIDAAD